MSPTILGAAPEGEKRDLINYGVLGGIQMGLISAHLWQRFYRTKLPRTWRSSADGAVPMLTAVAGILLSDTALSFVYPAFNGGFTRRGHVGGGNTILGGFVYGTLNRLLIPLGLHHILNNPPWFIIGSFTGADGVVYHGDIARFLHGDPTAGTFDDLGFFPIMMFALPAAAFAIWHEASPRTARSSAASCSRWRSRPS